MQVFEMLDKLIEDSSWNKSRLAKAMGMLPQTLNTRFTKANSPKVSFVVEMLNLLGYDLVAVPKGSNLPRGSVVVDPSSEE